MVEEIEQLEHELTQLKAQRQQTPKHVPWEDLPQEDKSERLAPPSRKRLVDTVKLIATAMAGIVREQMARWDDARARDLLRSEADILPDMEQELRSLVVEGAMAIPKQALRPHRRSSPGACHWDSRQMQ